METNREKHHIYINSSIIEEVKKFKPKELLFNMPYKGLLFLAYLQVEVSQVELNLNLFDNIISVDAENGGVSWCDIHEIYNLEDDFMFNFLIKSKYQLIDKEFKFFNLQTGEELFPPKTRLEKAITPLF